MATRQNLFDSKCISCNDIVVRHHLFLLTVVSLIHQYISFLSSHLHDAGIQIKATRTVGTIDYNQFIIYSFDCRNAISVGQIWNWIQMKNIFFKKKSKSIPNSLISVLKNILITVNGNFLGVNLFFFFFVFAFSNCKQCFVCG